jgi:hypothetical protein
MALIHGFNYAGVWREKHQDMYVEDYDSNYEIINNKNLGDDIMKNVKCVDASGRKYLTEGKVYQVAGMQSDGDYIITDDRGKNVKTYAKRFVDVVDTDNSVPFQVVCVDATNRKYLTEGKEYTAIEIRNDGEDYVIIDDRGTEIETYANRFKVVENVDTEPKGVEDVNTDTDDEKATVKNIKPTQIETKDFFKKLFMPETRELPFRFTFDGTIEQWKEFVNTFNGGI